ncbi:MAG: hypothetical protein V1853_01175 [bacterium]
MPKARQDSRIFHYVLWIVGIGVIIFGVVLSWTSSSNTNNSIKTTNEQAESQVENNIFTDYFDVGWRTGSLNSNILVEATYFYPELAAALEQLSFKSNHQGEIADRIALLKPNTDTIVFYITIASSAEEIAGLNLFEIFQVIDGWGNSYPILDWVEANTSLLPASTVTQRIGLLSASITADNQKTLEENQPGQLKLIVQDISTDDQVLTWDLNLIKTYLQEYERI